MEELLSQMAAEDEDDGQEDALALTGTAALAAVSPEGDEGEAAPAPAGDGGRREPAADGFPGRPAAEGLSEDGEGPENSLDSAPVWPAAVDAAGETERAVRRQAAEALGQAVQVLETARAEAAEAVAAGRAGDGGETVWGAAEREAGTGLEKLYRQTAQASRPAAPALPAGAAGRTIRVQEPGSAASLAVDELDRAVRRDSRRYDGGMSIF